MTSSNNEEYIAFNMNPKMEYRILGRSGLRVSTLALGGWFPQGRTVEEDPVKKIVQKAWENGINFIDTAETYQQGNSEREMCHLL